MTHRKISFRAYALSLLSPKGRVGRAEFWSTYAAGFVAMNMIAFQVMALSAQASQGVQFGLFLLPIALSFFVLSLVFLIVKRLRDAGSPAWLLPAMILSLMFTLGGLYIPQLRFETSGVNATPAPFIGASVTFSLLVFFGLMAPSQNAQKPNKTKT